MHTYKEISLLTHVNQHYCWILPVILLLTLFFVDLVSPPSPLLSAHSSGLNQFAVAGQDRLPADIAVECYANDASGMKTNPVLCTIACTTSDVTANITSDQFSVTGDPVDSPIELQLQAPDSAQDLVIECLTLPNSDEVVPQDQGNLTFTIEIRSSAPPCPAGYGVTADVCTYCPKGSSADSGSTACTECAAGSFSGQIASSSCDLCPIGFAQEEEGATFCNRCRDEETTNEVGATECVPGGSFSLSPVVRAVVFTCLGLLVIGGLFVALRLRSNPALPPKGSKHVSSSSSSAPSSSPAAEEAAVEKPDGGAEE